jgi:hypothetical protein
MDTARRWQVVSVATAIAGLGVGSLLVGRTPSTEIGPIDLDLVVATSEPLPPALDRPLWGSEIVPPVIREDQVEVPAPSSATDAGDDPIGEPAASLASPAAPAPAPAPTAPQPVESVDDLDSDDDDDDDDDDD